MTEIETEIERIGTKTRRHVYLSRELDQASRELLPAHRNFSMWCERVLWTAMIEEFGAEAVLEAVEDAQAEFDADNRLPPRERESYDLKP